VKNHLQSTPLTGKKSGILAEQMFYSQRCGMQPVNYFHPDTCIPGKQYFIKTKGLDSTINIKSVIFVGYCPHPAEIIVRQDGRNKVIHRVYLLQRNGTK